MAEQTETESASNIVKIEDAGPCKKKVIVEIPAETINKQTDKQYDSLAKEAAVPGFRKGRAPRRLLEKRFGKETTEQVKLKLLADASDSAVKDNELDIIGEPDIDYENIELPEEGAMSFEFEVEVRPDFKLPKLEGIAVEKPRLEVTDEQVDTEFEQLRRYSGVWTPREDGGIELDDQIIADAVLKVEDVEEEEKLDNTEISVRASGFVGQVPVQELDKLLVGAKTGDTKKTTVEVPKTYFREEYRGKKVDITIEVKEIKYLKPAEVNEQFLSRFGVEKVDELKENIRNSLQGRLERQLKTQMAEQVYKYLLDNADFELPASVVADYSHNIFRRQYANLMMQGLQREQIEQHMAELQASSEQQAHQQLKSYFIMDKVAKQFEFEVNDEELNGHIAQLAIQRGQRPERMKEQMVKDGSYESLRLQVRDEKAVEKILESAKITEVEPKEAVKKVKKSVKKQKTAEKEEKPAKKSTTSDKKTRKTTKKTTKKKTDK